MDYFFFLLYWLSVLRTAVWNHSASSCSATGCCSPGTRTALIPAVAVRAPQGVQRWDGNALRELGCAVCHLTACSVGFLFGI